MDQHIISGLAFETVQWPNGKIHSIKFPQSEPDRGNFVYDSTEYIMLDPVQST